MTVSREMRRHRLAINLFENMDEKQIINEIMLPLTLEQLFDYNDWKACTQKAALTKKDVEGHRLWRQIKTSLVELKKLCDEEKDE